ncbi:hypothetical protein KCG44_12100 [Pacificimonas sp. WHA3]|uniref:DUF6265 domain-containing protein n=1 Tax=Pacificimonas pallii TaxID=2827236 RepID=A0ABS6SGI0_9SPHN|nr:DUF6265 family protein [Pacificimonas pallii]MBV7257527.1 hypothetical protein [Pacificimonas pallii]
MKSVIVALSLTLMAFTGTPDVRSLDEGAVSPPATLASLQWLVGHWVGKGLGGETEEVYAAATDGQMMGMFRYVKDGKAGFYEFILIEEREGSLVYRLKHFNRDLTGWEEKDEIVEFPLVAISDDTAWFDGVTLQRAGDDEMRVGLRVGTKDGVRHELFEYQRAE